MPFKAAHCVPVWCAWLILNLPGVAVAEVQDAPINQHDEVKELRLALGALREEYAQRIAALGLFGDRGLSGTVYSFEATRRASRSDRQIRSAARSALEHPTKQLK